MSQSVNVLYLKSRTLFLFFHSNTFAESTKTVFLPQSFKDEWVQIPVSFGENIGNEEIFSMLNQDDNPLGTPANQAWVRQSGARHTSMSVGDVIVRGGDYFVCLPIGYKRVSFIQEVN